MKPSRLPALAAAMVAPLAPMNAETDYATAVPKLEAAVRQEMQDWGIGGVALALTDGTRIVHTGGFGEADVDSVFRAGSISKLFNAMAVMQMVEAGRIDLDAPLSDFPILALPHHPFPDAPPVTVRQLLCHRSGLQRESPVGGYFDSTEPTLAATCESLAGCVIATPPVVRTRYSNIAPSLAGHVVATLAGQPFERYQQERLLGPLGMDHSVWRRTDVAGGRVIVSRMRIADGKGGFVRAEAPLFDLGTIPAGNLFTTAPDLAKFLVELARAMRGESTVLRPSTVAEMWRPQFDEAAGFGIAFVIGKFRHHRSVGHNGAVYGHSTALVFLPESQLGVVVLGNEDIVNARIGRLADLALSLMLEVKTGEKAPASANESALSAAAPPLDGFAGNFESRSFWAQWHVETGRLVGNCASQPCTLTRRGDWEFLLNSRLHSDALVVFHRDAAGAIAGFTVGPQTFSRVAEPAPTLPELWKRYLGQYGPDFIPLVVHEKFGHLYVTTENMVDYRMTPVNRHVFGLPPGMYVDELAVFLCDAAGQPHSIDFASMTFPRR
ncbi:MAG: serine hydrolase domain-containing protein [Verrucomicrobiales bacterium]